MSTRILVVIGTPLPDTLNHALARSYVDAARAGGAEVRVIDLAVDEIPPHPTDRAQLRAPRTDEDRPLDRLAAEYLGALRWADHLAVFFPQWWGTYPAALKAFIDATFLSNAAFRYRETSALSERLLTGRTARLVMTMDSPRWWNRLAYRNAAETSLRRAVLGYCGIRTTGITRLTPIRFSVDAQRQEWIARTAALGARDAAAVPSRRAARADTTVAA